MDGEPVDIGLVGDIVATDPGLVRGLIADGRIPVVSSVARGADGDGVVYNVNADTAAAALAVALGAAKLVVLTDVAGLYRGLARPRDEVISQLARDDLEKLLPALSAGMIPKMEACLTAVRGGVPQAHVLDGRLPARDPAGDLHRLRHRHDGDAEDDLTPIGRPDRESEALRERFEAAMMPNYGTPPLALARGEGCRVWDADGNQYLDLIAGIAVSALGHAHPAIVEAVSGQVGKLAHTSNLFVHEPGVQLAERLLGLLDAGGQAACSSATPAPRPTRPPSSWSAAHRARTGRLVAADRQLPRPDDGRARASPARSRSGRRSARSASMCAGSRTATRRPWPAPSTQKSRRSSSSRRWVRAASCRRRTGTCAPSGRPATPRGRCWCSTRSRAGSAAPASGSPTRRRASSPTCSRSPRASAAACRSAPASASARRAPRCARATTAPRSAATRSPAPPPSRCSTPSRRDGMLGNVKTVG